MTLDALRYGGLREMETGSDLSRQKLLCAYCEHPVLPGIGVLLCGCRPSAVLLGIRPIVVLAIQGVRRAWSWSHILPELYEVIDPLCGNRDSAPPISWIGWVSGVKTSLFHLMPRAVFGAAGKAVGSTETSITDLTHKTATTGCSSGSQVVPRHHGLFATIANTPPRNRFPIWYAGKNKQAAKSLAGQVHQFHGTSIACGALLVNTLGYTVLGFQAMAEQIKRLEAKVAALSAA